MNVFNNQEVALRVRKAKYEDPGLLVLAQTGPEDYGVLDNGLQVVELVPADELSEFIHRAFLRRQRVAVMPASVCVIEQC